MCTDLPSSTATVTPRRALLASAGVAATAALTAGGSGVASAAGRSGRRPSRHCYADLSYVFAESFPSYVPAERPVRLPGTTIAADGYYQQRWNIYEHTGTHVDAPAHFAAGGRYASELRPEELVLPVVVVDIRGRAARDADTVVTVDDLRRHERRHGRIADDAAVVMNSGWGAKAGDADAYRGADAAGGLHFPGFSDDACAWLLARRRVRALGVDTLSIDPGNSAEFPVHLRLNGADRYGIENLANVDALPPRGAQLTVGLIPWEQGSGGPARVLARW